MNFKQTNIACPEQYDIVNKNGELLGCMTFRFGTLKVYPYRNCLIDFDKLLFERSVNDDYLGIIPESVKSYWMNEALNKILDYFKIGLND